jgi:hypothetical protein
VNKLGKACYRESGKREHRYKRSAYEKTGNNEGFVIRKYTLVETSMYDALYICGLFSDTVSTSDYIALNCSMVNEE